MMSALGRLEAKWSGRTASFLIHADRALTFDDVMAEPVDDLAAIRPGEVVALIGDYDPRTIRRLLHLADLGAIVVPLTHDTRGRHEDFFRTSLVDVVVDGDEVERSDYGGPHPLLDELRARQRAGLVVFSTGTTGDPKAVVHDLDAMLSRFDSRRPGYRIASFLVFDHFGGINTLLRTLFGLGSIVVPTARSVDGVLEACARHAVEVLPTTPTFLRMLLMSGKVPGAVPESLKTISYGTERMDQGTLTELCRRLPSVDFKQTYGLTELGVFKVTSTARDSLFMRLGGDVEARVADGVLQLRTPARMLGYLNAPSPFDSDGWYDTGDVVEERSDALRIVGRRTDVINVGGSKFAACDVESAALAHPGVALAAAFARENPITGQHVEMTVQPHEGSSFDVGGLKQRLREQLPAHMVPTRIRVGEIVVGHRFKRSGRPDVAGVPGMKQGSETDARARAIEVTDDDGRRIGELVPVGPWVLERSEIIEAMTQWRHRAMRFFFSRFEASTPSMTTYLRELSIAEPGRLLFLVFDDGGRLVGHMGVKDIAGSRAELDNFIRGRSGGHRRLMQHAERTLLGWCFDSLRLDVIEGRVISYNLSALTLHREAGFEVARSIPLRKVVEGERVTHLDASGAEANVSYTCEVIALSRERFEARR